METVGGWFDDLYGEFSGWEENCRGWCWGGPDGAAAALEKVGVIRWRKGDGKGCWDERMENGEG